MTAAHYITYWFKHHYDRLQRQSFCHLKINQDHKSLERVIFNAGIRFHDVHTA